MLPVPAGRRSAAAARRSQCGLDRFERTALGLGEEEENWRFELIGTEKEKMGVEKELQELRKRIDKVDEWKQRREKIEKELNRVWVEDGELAPPPYEEEVKEENQTEEVNAAEA